MKKIDAMHLEPPLYGSRRLRDGLQLIGYAISRKKIQRLMREMGLCALYPKRNLEGYLSEDACEAFQKVLMVSKTQSG